MSQDETYQRYRFTKDGISPRIAPCTGIGLVQVAGNEHIETGFSDEDPHRAEPGRVPAVTV